MSSDPLFGVEPPELPPKEPMPIDRKHNRKKSSETNLGGSVYEKQTNKYEQ